MENFQEIVVAWAKLATIGARPVAESVGIDRDFFARVLNKRRELTQENAKLLGDALGLNADGFADQRVQSNLCRQTEDLEAVESLGFETRYIAHIKSHKELKGGQSLQKYILVKFSYGEKSRLSIMRMATEKWHRLIESLNFPDLLILEIDTLLIAELNAINATFEDTRWQELQDVLVTEDKLYAVSWMEELLQDLIRKQIENSGRHSIVKRVERKTDLLRIANKQTTLSDWPAAAVHYAQSHILTPISHEFSPALAVGIRNDEKRVFVYLTSLRTGQSLTFDIGNQAKIDQVVIFHSHTKDPKSKYDVLYDGPISLLIETANKLNLIQDGRINLSINSLFFLDEVTRPEHALKRRKNRGG